MKFDLEAHLIRQAKWSQATFGPGKRMLGVCEHIQKELIEIAASPDDVMEWIDVIILAFDGALRAGMKPFTIVCCLEVESYELHGSADSCEVILDLVDVIRNGDSETFIDIVSVSLSELGRQGWPREAIWYAMLAKQLKNEKRKWPDWRTRSEDEAITHIEEGVA